MKVKGPSKQSKTFTLHDQNAAIDNKQQFDDPPAYSRHSTIVLKSSSNKRRKDKKYRVSKDRHASGSSCHEKSKRREQRRLKEGDKCCDNPPAYTKRSALVKTPLKIRRK